MNKRKSWYDWVIIFSPAVLESASDPFPNLEGDVFTGGQVRMQAAVEAFKIWPSARFVMLGGMASSRSPNSFFKKAEVMADFFQQRCGVRPLTVNSLPCTRHNIIALFNKFGNELVELDKLAILSNRYHRNRLLQFWKRGREGLPLVAEPDFLSAEDLIPDKGIIRRYREQLKKRVLLERKGLQDLSQGKYVDNCLTKFKNSGLISLLDWPEHSYLFAPAELQEILHTNLV